MAVDIPGLCSIIVFYVLILAIGVFAARKTGFKTKNLKVSELMLANRSIGLFVGTFTMTATWVGGGYINGSTEVTYTNGLVWCQAPVCYSIGLLFSGLFFARKMRISGFTTMLDPFHWKYGDVMNCLLYIPALSGDVFWSASILAALGGTLKVILDINLETAIIVSAAISLAYTLIGGLYSVAYTDVVQLGCLFFGLWLCVPFAMTHEATTSITENSTDITDGWIGQLTGDSIGLYIDLGLLIIYGGIPWQVYWQRALSAKTEFIAEALSFIAAFGCLISAVPAILLGAVAKYTDWNQTDYGQHHILLEDRSLTLPLVMRYLCPTAVTFIGLGAVSAAVMSSTDSSILSSSSMFSRNVFSVIYIRIHKKGPSEAVQVWVMRAAQVVIAALGCVMAIAIPSIYELFVLCGDFLYVVMIPQLICVMYLKGTNSYGSLAAYVAGFFFRLAGGEVALRIPAIIEYPWYKDGTQYFPFRTLAMLISLITHIAVSYSIDFIFRKGYLPLKYDYYGCFQHWNSEVYPSQQNGYYSQEGIDKIKTDGAAEITYREDPECEVLNPPPYTAVANDADVHVSSRV